MYYNIFYKPRIVEVVVVHSSSSSSIIINLIVLHNTGTQFQPQYNE